MLLNKVALDDSKEQKLLKSFKTQMSHEKLCLHLYLSKIFFSSSKDALVYMDCCFLIISETENFLKLEISLLEEILSRSSMLVTTEIEVYQAVNKWINHDFKERVKFAKRLLHKIRLPLLSERTLKTILTEKNCFRENKDSLAVVNDILKANFYFYRNKPSKFFTARYCGHDSFDILCFGGSKRTKKIIYDDKILQIQHFDDCKNPKIISSLAGKRCGFEAVYLRGSVYLFGGRGENYGIVKEVEMYNHLTKTCKVVSNIEDINDCDLMNYAVCSFMDKIYLIGGYDKKHRELNSCIEFDTKYFSWKHKSEMQERRENPASCVLEEKIIVSGGTQKPDDDFVDFVNFYDVEGKKTLNTVEAYDPIDDTWTEFPSMNYSRCRHKSVVVKNKLFVIAGGTNINEVYDSTSKKFTVLKPSFSLSNTRENCLYVAFSVGHKLFTHFRRSSNIFCFDTTKGEWCEKPSEATKHLICFSAVTVPRLLSEM